MENDQFYLIFRCAVASLYEVVSYRPSVGPSVRMSRVIFEGENYAYKVHLVPCIRPCC